MPLLLYRLGKIVRDPRPWLILFLLQTVRFFVTTDQRAYKTWAGIAIGGYASASALALWQRTRHLAAPVAAIGVVLIPLVVLIALDQGQPEVGVIRDGGMHLLHAGTPYLSHPTQILDFRPYLPALFLFGLLPSIVGDPRILATLLLAAAVVVTVRVFRSRAAAPSDARDWRPQLFLLSVPVVAVALTGSFIDIPQTALSMLAFAALATDRYRVSGVLVGLTLAMKPTALVVAFVLALTAWRRGQGLAVFRLCGSAVAVMLACVIPVALRDRHGLWVNAIEFPLGLTGPKSPAATPFPGVLLRQAGVSSHWILALLLVAGMLYAAWCLRSSTGDVRLAAAQAAGGLVLIFMLIPYSREGYLVLPIMLALPIYLASARDVANPNRLGLT